MPVETNAEGKFSISVPIGKHIIKVAKNGHTLIHEGNYPATGEQEFVENRDDVVTFIDNSRVTLVGKVVGGSVEAAKTIGFGEKDKIREEAYFEDGSNVESKVRISAKNNIGVASIALGYKPPSGDISPKTTFTFPTDRKTGEYRVRVLPLEYTLSENDVKVVETDLKLLTGSEQLNLEEIKSLITPEFTMPDAKATIIKGEPYQYVKNFIYRSNPELTTIEQTRDETITIGDKTFNTNGVIVSNEAVYFYTQTKPYTIKLKSLERYINQDIVTSPIEDLVPITDGELSVTNNLALANSEGFSKDPKNASIYIYTFRGGLPSISSPFIKSLEIGLVINNVYNPATGYINNGIVLGALSDGSQTFVTNAPERPDIILRDPPGSNSFASIEKGESISITNSTAISTSNNVGLNVKILTGMKIVAGGGLAGPVISAESRANVEMGLGVTVSTDYGKSNTTTYDFSKTISTSDSPDFVGADADLYIGNSQNVYYGSYDDVGVYAEAKSGSENLEIKTTDNKSFFISKQKAMFFDKQPSTTFFIYSQHHILNTLIPELELIVQNIDNGIVLETSPGVQKRSTYVNQINIWKKVIQQNEKTKYNALNDRKSIKDQALKSVEDFYEKEGTFNFHDDLKKLIEEKSYDNVSFDAGVGEYTQKTETTTVIQENFEVAFDFEESVKGEFGFLANESVGVVVSPYLTLNQGRSAGSESENVKTTFISYTLKDNDTSNFFSVDIINAFDGNGPIFSTKGGRSSCPYEGPELSNFYNKLDYDAAATIIPLLAEAKRERLSYATQAVEKPIISVKVAEVFDVQESDKAEFELILENNGAAEGIDANYLLVVDNISNPDNAIFNIEQNGTVVRVPYGKKVPYRLTMQKSSANVFDYKDVVIRLQSLCDGADISAEVPVTAHFVPACSIVKVEEPKENWVFNRTVSKFSGASARDPLSIKLGAYNKNYTNFSRMQLQYRLATSTTWSNLHTYYKNQTDLDLAVTNGADVTTLSLISVDEKNNQVPFDWYVAGKKDGDIPLQDGAYEIRAISYCSNNTQYVSPVIAGKVDFTSPRRFASPEPTNGILNAGDDIKVSFNEPIFYNSAISQIEISGRTNQLPIDNNVSLQFSGPTSSATIEKPDVSSGNITFEWWMLNKTPLNTGGTILKQANNLEVGLTATNKIYFVLAGKRIETDLNTSDLFHHYAVTYRANDGYMGIYKDDVILVENQFANLKFDSNESLIVGNSSFQGNIHSLRYWNKYISSVDAAANMRTQTLGNEANLLGFWSMQEGKGIVAKDAARFKHAKITASWDIKPKGESYAFTGQNYLAMDQSGFVVLNKEMDATISFWMKANAGNSGTLFSNGKGDGTDLDQANGGDGKWAIALDSSTGKLQFLSEGNKFNLTDKAVNNDAWHHVVVVLNRLGSLNTYVDGEKVTALSPKGIGAFSGNKIWFGARAFTDQTGAETFSDHYTGLLDEFTFWNSARTQEQFLRDQYSEIDREQLGLVFYSRFNKATDGSNNTIAPTYTRLIAGNKVEDTTASLNLGGTLSYSTETPALIPQRPLIKFKVNHVINQDQMILEPDVTSWASLEGQVLDITVHRMYDALGNEQNSPITWTALINKNDVSWFADKANDGLLDIVKPQDETSEFNITLVNRGGKSQPYEITNIPNWLTLSKTSGVLNPNSTFVIKATISNLVATNIYFENLHLKTDFGFDKLLQLNLRVLAKAPDWTIDPSKFIYSMNIVGQIKVDGILSDDKYDMIAAFVGNELRGVSSLKKITSVDKWLTYFTIYSNEKTTTEQLSFKIWDASSGLVLAANADAKATIPFEENQVLGKLSLPVTFENSSVVEQKITFNTGWTWVSMNVNDPNFTDLNTLTKGLNLETSDRMLTNSPARLETYYKNEAIPANSGWSGTISAYGGLTNSNMIKVFLAHEQPLTIKGTVINVANWSFPMQEKWNWLPYILGKNQLTNEALAYFDAADGDVIKSQNLFAIYDPIIGWSGTLNYLEAGKGYMVKSSKAQTFKYPSYLATTSKMVATSKSQSATSSSQEEIGTAFSQYPDNMNAVVLLPTGYNELFVYDAKGILKGAAVNQSVNNSNLSFITVYGDTTEELAFYIGNGISNKKTSKKFVFKGNDVLGTISKPIVLEEMTAAVSIYPSPFDNEITIKANALQDQIISIRLYSLSGKSLLNINQNVVSGENVLKIQPIVPSGAYLLQIDINGETITHKVMKN
ncbi:LamG-like jellyroll fold domain-containing protein [Flavobacterium sp.]|uniref:LamG-like jellyroll fold domain-containing protein n=1 Tax=Flavobacterium sp. TaxID=239 RepID=UPI003C64DD29